MVPETCNTHKAESGQDMSRETSIYCKSTCCSKFIFLNCADKIISQEVLRLYLSIPKNLSLLVSGHVNLLYPYMGLSEWASEDGTNFLTKSTGNIFCSEAHSISLL